LIAQGGNDVTAAPQTVESVTDFDSEYANPIEITNEMVESALARWASTEAIAANDHERMWAAIRSALWVCGKAPDVPAALGHLYPPMKFETIDNGDGTFTHTYS
jgi:hypothetical protein